MRSARRDGTDRRDRREGFDLRDGRDVVRLTDTDYRTHGPHSCMALDGLPEDWTVWHDDGRVVIVFRPDVFSGDAHDPAHLPTLYVSTRPPDVPMRRGDEPRDRWHVACTLEPEVHLRALESSHDTRSAAVEAAVEAARRFSSGEIDLRGVYATAPPAAYLDALEDLVG